MQSAVLGTIWNRWCTARRFQRRDSDTNTCVFRCSLSAEDSIEHYSQCPCTLRFASRFLRLDCRTQVNLHTFNLCNPRVSTQEELVVTAVLIYAIYRGANHYRYHTPGSPEEVHDALRQWALEGVMRHERSARIVRNLWATSRSHTALPSVPSCLSTRHHGSTQQSIAARSGGKSRKRSRSDGQQCGSATRACPRVFVIGGTLSVAEVSSGASTVRTR